MAIKFISEVIEYQDEERISLGMMASHRWHMDPKVLLFSMARHKFVSKMIKGKKDVLDIGCGDGWGMQIVAKEVDRIRAYDMDPKLVKECNAMVDVPNVEFFCWDFCSKPVEPVAEAAYLLDVLEHVHPKDEDRFLGNIAASLVGQGVCIVGIPSLESQAYASKPSRLSHVNCKRGEDLRATMSRHFHNVFMFSMNDEVVHTGFMPMAHYLFAMGVCPLR